MAGAEAEAARKRAWAGVQAVFDRYHKLAEKSHGELFDYDCMKRVELIDVDPSGSVVYRFVPTQRYANLNNVMHGGAYGVLFDMFTMSALGTITKPDYWEFMGGVTRTLNISYLKAVPIGTAVYFRSRVVQHGRTLALIKGEMTSEDGRTVYATAEHHKVNIPMLPEHRAARVAWDESVAGKPVSGVKALSNL